MANFTQQAILHTFVELLSKKSFDKITVKEIVDKCQITRRTFYYHFDDLYAVVKYLIRSEIKKTFDEYSETDNLGDSLISACRFVLDNKSAVYHLYTSVHKEEILNYFDVIIMEVVERFFDSVSNSYSVDELDRRLICSFYKNALIGYFTDWLDDGMKIDPEISIKRIVFLLDGNMEKSIQLCGESSTN